MKTIRFDEGFKFDDKNNRWGDPSYQLEPGDPGYVPPDSPSQPQTPQKTKRMKRQNYYPSRIADQVLWLPNYADKLPGHGTAVGLTSGEVTASVADALWLNYVLGSWLTAVRTWSPSCTAAVDAALSGTGSDPLTLPIFTAPDLPTGVAPAAPGALDRIFGTVQSIKTDKGYTDVIGTDLRIIGPAVPATPGGDHSAPQFKLETVQGGAGQAVKITFRKQGHAGVYIESRRGGSDFQFLAVDTESPYLDERPLLTAGQPEVREYRLRFWDKGTPNGDWTDTAQATVAP